MKMSFTSKLFLFCMIFCLLISCVSLNNLKKTNSGTVLVVFCVDTESNAFNYKKYKQSLNLNSFKPKNIIDQTFNELLRKSIIDSFGGSFKISWFLMTIEGYRYTPQGINAIANEFTHRYSLNCIQVGDEIGWHYHHADWYKDSMTNQFGWNKITTFSNKVYNKKNDRQLAVQQYATFVYLNEIVPAIFRSGWDWENTQFSNWLDSLIPFDYSNNWPEVNEDLFLYNPDKNNLYKQGNLSREVVRSISIIDTSYMNSLFGKAKKGQDVIFSIYTHNYGGTVKHNNPIVKMITRVNKLLHEKSKLYGVRFKYCTASEAINTLHKMSDCQDYKLVFNYNNQKRVINADYNNNTFGTPLVCYKSGNDINASFMKHDTINNIWSLQTTNTNIDSFIVVSISKCGKSFISEKFAY